MGQTADGTRGGPMVIAPRGAGGDQPAALAPENVEAAAIHAAYPTVDLHADTLMWCRWLGYDVLTRHEPPLPINALGGHVDVPRMRDGGMGAQFFSLVTLPVMKGARGPAHAVHAQIDILEQAMLHSPRILRPARTAADIDAINAAGALGALLGIEGAHALEGELDKLEEFSRRGVRYLGLLHFSANEAGYPAYGRGRADEKGLTRWGLDLVKRCESLDVIVDLSHLNKRGFLDACAIATRPPIVSHTGVLGAFEHWRNIDDEQLRAIAARGGCVGVIFCPRFIGGHGFEPVVRHLKHIIDVAGEDAPALGSDWDGLIVPTRELADPRGLPRLTRAMLESGMTERQIGKILRGNAMRILGTG